MNEFGCILEVIRRDKRVSYPQMSHRIANHGWQLDRVTIEYIARGRRFPTGQECHWICESLLCSDEERKKLHRAAAVDAGYMIEDYQYEPQT